MIKAISRTLLALAALMTLGLVAPAAVSAQAPVQVEPIENLEDEELQTFAKAYLEIMDISREMQARLAEEPAPEEAQAAQMEAQQKMQAVLEEHELEEERYRRIAVTVNTDEEVAERFVAILEELDPGNGTAG